MDQRIEGNVGTQFNRHFQAWEYTVSHGQLLFRSTKGRGFQTQIDILFKGVQFMQIPKRLFLIEVLEIDRSHLAEYLQPGTLKDDFRLFDCRIFRLRGTECDGLIIAGVAVWVESDDNYYDDSRLIPGPNLRFQ